MRFLFIAFLVILYSSLFGQQSNSRSKSFSGIVLSSIDSSAIEFAHVKIHGTGIGTITGSGGEFNFHFNDTIYYSSDSIIISCIGYKSKSFSISNLKRHSQVQETIFLAPEYTLLNEVTITSTSSTDTLATFLGRVLSRVKNNYVSSTHYYEGFFRQISQNSDSASRLIEAAIDIKDIGYFKKTEKVRVRVNQLRKSDDYINYSWVRGLYKLTFGTSNDIIRTFNSDLLRLGNELANGKNVMDLHDLRLDSIVENRDGNVAFISFNSYRNGDSVLLFHKTKLCVNLRDLGILRSEHSWVPNPNIPLPNQEIIFYKGIHRVKKIVEYQKIGMRYFPFFISVFEPVRGAAVSRSRKQEYKESIILINNIVVKSDQSRIRNGDRENTDEDIYEKDFPYDSEFWKNYNIVIRNPLNNKDLFSLERNQNLDKQFVKNGYRSRKK